MCRFMWNERNSRKLLWKPDRSPLLRPSCGHDVILKCFLFSLSETCLLSSCELCTEFRVQTCAESWPRSSFNWSKLSGEIPGLTETKHRSVPAKEVPKLKAGYVRYVSWCSLTHKWSESEMIFIVLQTGKVFNNVTLGIIISFLRTLPLTLSIKELI